MSFLLHEFFYFGRCLPWYIIDKTPYFRKWKIQEDKVATSEQQWKALKYVLLTHFTIEMPQIVLFEPMATYFGMATYHVPFPSWSTMIPQIIGFFFFEGESLYSSGSRPLTDLLQTSSTTGLTAVCITDLSTKTFTSCTTSFLHLSVSQQSMLILSRF